MTLVSKLSATQELLIDGATRHGAVGAALAVGRGDEVFEAVTGVVNHDTGVEVTRDSAFQIGSITKVLTTTLVMQLVEEGRIELEAPIRKVLPEFQVADPEATEQITLAHLLTHTSGIDGDFFLDTGCGDDCIERYVLACSALSQLHEPGERLSYCNAGFVIVGRIIEKLRGLPWHTALRERLLQPLGLSSMGTEPERAILQRAAVGHVTPEGGGAPRVIPIWRLAPSNGPAGATPFARARDLLRIARLHLDEGKAPNGTQILQSGSVREMQQRRVEMPTHAFTDGQGLGWMLFDWDGERVIGHDGGTIGQASFLRIHPPTGVVVSLLTSGGDAGSLYREVFQEVMNTLCDVSLPSPIEELPSVDVPLANYTGRYERLSTRYDVEIQGGAVVLSAVGRKPPMSWMPPARTPLRAVGAGTFVTLRPSGLARSPILFSDFDADGRPRYLEVGLRSTPRVA